jgi:hypothetical protein
MSTESQTPWYGPFSTYTEIHAFGVGLYDGLTGPIYPAGIRESTLDNEDVAEESHYAKSGYMIGWVAKVTLLYVAYKVILDHREAISFPREDE